MTDLMIKERVRTCASRERARPGRWFSPLLSAPVPELLPEQLAGFAVTTLHAHPTRFFDPGTVLRQVREREGQAVLAVDMGGDKLAAATYSVRGGRLTLRDEPRLLRGDGGAG